jgi:hypothetical protein
MSMSITVRCYPALKLSFQERISTPTEKTKEDLIRRQEQGGYHPDPRSDNEPSPTWCRCTHCREMLKEVEEVCCDQAPEKCYSRVPVCYFYLHMQLEVQFLFTLEYMTAPFH